MNAIAVINRLYALGICVPIAGAYVIQFGYGEKPCPLCLLQRLAMFGVAVGPLMNLRFGVRPRHYALSLFSALFGASVSTRQILLHICPGNPNGPGYGSPVLGMYLYTWALCIFVATIFLLGLMMFFDAQFAADRLPAPRPLTGWTLAAMLIAALLAFANILTTYQLCGLGSCPDNP